MADKEEAKTGAAGATPDAKADAKAKRKMKLPSLPPLPMNMIVLVAVPFLVFVAVFLYAMGYFPGKPVVFNISVVNPGGTPSEAAVSDARLASPAGSEEQSAGADSSATTEGEAKVAGAGPGANPMRSTSQASADSAYSIERLARELGLGDSLASATRPDTLTEAEKTKKIKQMAKVYEQMTAGSVAAIVDNLPEDEAVRILAVMTPRSAAKVMGALGPEKAAVMSLMLTGFER